MTDPFTFDKSKVIKRPLSEKLLGIYYHLPDGKEICHGRLCNPDRLTENDERDIKVIVALVEQDFYRYVASLSAHKKMEILAAQREAQQ